MQKLLDRVRRTATLEPTVILTPVENEAELITTTLHYAKELSNLFFFNP